MSQKISVAWRCAGKATLLLLHVLCIFYTPMIKELGEEVQPSREASKSTVCGNKIISYSKRLYNGEYSLAKK